MMLLDPREALIGEKVQSLNFYPRSWLIMSTVCCPKPDLT